MTTKRDGDRFWAKVNKTETCWLWTGAIQGQGYGAFYFGATTVRAHRFAYLLQRGSIPEGVQIDHTCHRWHTDCQGGKNCIHRRCVNPAHLRLSFGNKQNQENRAGAQSNNHSSGVRGVTWDKRRQRWLAQIGHNGRNLRVGDFDTIEDAEAAVIAKRNELFTHNDSDRTAK